jgi:hypothetical protein
MDVSQDAAQTAQAAHSSGATSGMLLHLYKCAPGQPCAAVGCGQLTVASLYCLLLQVLTSLLLHPPPLTLLP